MSSPTSTDSFTQERPNKPMMKFWGPAANDDSIVRAHERHTAVCRPLAQDPPPGTVGICAPVTPANHARRCRPVRHRSYRFPKASTPHRPGD